MKKAICMMLAGVFCLLSLCACTRRASVSVNGTPMGKGLRRILSMRQGRRCPMRPKKNKPQRHIGKLQNMLP